MDGILILDIQGGLMNEHEVFNSLYGKFYDREYEPCNWTIIPCYGARWVQNPHTRPEYIREFRYCK